MDKLTRPFVRSDGVWPILSQIKHSHKEMKLKQNSFKTVFVSVSFRPVGVLTCVLSSFSFSQFLSMQPRISDIIEIHPAIGAVSYDCG